MQEIKTQNITGVQGFQPAQNYEVLQALPIGLELECDPPLVDLLQIQAPVIVQLGLTQLDLHSPSALAE